MLFGLAQLILSFLIRLKLNHFSTAYSTQTNMDSDSTIFKSKCRLTTAPLSNNPGRPSRW